MKLEFICSIENGTIKRNRKLFVESIKQFEGKEIIITVEKNKKKRSNNQNKFYWGIVIEIMRSNFNQIGYLWSKERVHEALRFRFLQCERVNKVTGEMFQDFKSTTELSTVEFIEYLLQIKEFALEYFNSIIPDPNEQDFTND